jgi:4-carboxymuconolactone decarboxylase
VSRIPPLSQDEWDLEALSALSLGQQLPPSNLVGLLAHHPELAKAFLTFNMHLLATSSLPKRTRELIILRVAWRRRCRYEWGAHVRIGRRAGLTDEEIDEVRAGAPTLLNRAVDELAGHSRLSDETYQELAAALDRRQLMDLVFTIGAYDMLAGACNTFGVEPDPGMPDENFNFIT